MIRLLVVCVVAVWVGAVTNRPTAVRPSSVRAEEPPPRPIKPKRPALILAEFDKSRVRVGDTVRLTELVPISRDIRVQSIAHTVYKIGEFDHASGELINLETEKFLYAGDDVVFGESGGIHVALGDKYFPYSVMNPRQEGLEFEFRAQQLGIFLVKAKWTLWRSQEVIESNPVVLTVLPADAKVIPLEGKTGLFDPRRQK